MSPNPSTALSALPRTTCCASSFSTAEIAVWLEWLATNVSPQMAVVIRNVRRDVDHPQDGIAAFIQHNDQVELPPSGGS